MLRCRTIVTDSGRPWWLRAAALDVLLTDPDDVNNSKAISDGIRVAPDLLFYRQAVALFLQRSRANSLKQMQAQLKRMATPHADRLYRYLDSTPPAPDRWLGH